MVTIVGYSIRTQKDGEKKQYIALELEGDVEMVQSQQTGRFYATVRRCTVTSSFDELTAQRMVNKQMPGSIVRVPCSGYDYIVPESGEVINLSYRWDYQPEGAGRVYQPRQRVAAAQPANEEELVVEEEPVVV